MKTINLAEERLDIEAIIALAREEPILILTSDGREFFVSEADDFDREVEALRTSEAFQRFLDERSQSKRRIPLEEIELEIDKEMEEQERND